MMRNGYCFNLKENYIYWNSLNWFGVYFFTILYWIVAIPVSPLLFLEFVFTVGRMKGDR